MKEAQADCLTESSLITHQKRHLSTQPEGPLAQPLPRGPVR